jgi:hypothetical protein
MQLQPQEVTSAATEGRRLLHSLVNRCGEISGISVLLIFFKNSEDFKNYLTCWKYTRSFLS